MIVRIIFVIFLFLLIGIPFPGTRDISARNQESDPNWRTTEFKVLWHSPYSPDVLRELRDLVMTPDERKMLNHLDLFMRYSFAEIAKYYRSQNLKEPKLPIVKDEDGTYRWVVYAYAFKSGFFVTETEEFSSGYYGGNFCLRWQGTPLGINTFTALSINTGNFLDREIKDIRDREYQNLYSTLAHELFHAIQASYDGDYSSLGSCVSEYGNGGAPLSEGTATAAANFAAKKKYPGFFDDLSVNNSKVGAFPYSFRDFMKVGSYLQEKEKGASDPNLAYKTSSFWQYLAEKYGGLRVFDTMFRRKLTFSGNAPTIKERYQWLEDNILEIAGKELYLVLPEFFAELASYPDSQNHDYKAVDKDVWMQNIYRYIGSGYVRDCHSVKLTKENGGVGEVELRPNYGALELGATCIDVEWSGMDKPFVIDVEAKNPDEKKLDQLHLGISRLATKGNQDNCVDWIYGQASGESDRRNYDCSFGRLFIRNKASENNPNKEWELDWPKRKDAFFSRESGASGKATLILSNIAPKPADTVRIPDAPTAKKSNDKLIIRFGTREVRTTAARKFEPPTKMDTLLATGAIGPVLTPTVNRYSFYGIGKKMLPAGNGLGFRLVDKNRPEITYVVTPMERNGIRFGQTGPFLAVVSKMSVGNNPLMNGGNSSMCESSRDMSPNANIKRSDDFQLRFTLKTDICTVDFSTGRARIVETLDVDLLLPFGRKYFPETEQKDVVTPGVELYIDEYIRDAAALGVPIPSTVRLLDGSIPQPGGNTPTGGGGGNGTGSGSGNGNQTKDGKFVCTCSCEQYKKIRRTLEEASKSGSSDPGLMPMVRCLQRCMPQISKCPQK